MIEQAWASVALGLCAGLSVCAAALATIAWRAADPVRVRSLTTTVDAVAAEVEDGFKHMRDVELTRIVSQCEAVLERADDRFDAAERKRRSVNARGQQTGEDDLAQVLADPSVPRAEKIRRLRLKQAG